MLGIPIPPTFYSLSIPHPSDKVESLISLISSLLLYSCKFHSLVLLISHCQYLTPSDVIITEKICHLIKNDEKFVNIHIVMTTTPQKHPVYSNTNPYYLDARDFMIRAEKFANGPTKTEKSARTVDCTLTKTQFSLPFTIALFSVFVRPI